MTVSKPRIVVTHWVHPEVARYLAGFSDALIPPQEGGVFPPEQVADLTAGADGVIACMADRVDDAFLARCPRLRVVSATLKGYDNFDAGACTRRGIWLTIVPDTIIAPTAELAIGLTIGLMRKIAAGDARIRRGDFTGWRPQLYGAGLSGAAVGIAGMGQLGQAIARRLAGFEAHIAYHDERRLDARTEQALSVSCHSLEQVAEISDVLIAALPLDSHTRHLINSDLIRRMHPGAFVVNVGRGSVIDEDAIADALDSGRLGGYAADVFAMEDWMLSGHPPAISDRLLRHPWTLFTPHLGSAVDEVRRRSAMTRRSARRQTARATPVLHRLVEDKHVLAIDEPLSLRATNRLEPGPGTVTYMPGLTGALALTDSSERAAVRQSRDRG